MQKHHFMPANITKPTVKKCNFTKIIMQKICDMILPRVCFHFSKHPHLSCGILILDGEKQTKTFLHIKTNYL